MVHHAPRHVRNEYKSQANAIKSTAIINHTNNFVQSHHTISVTTMLSRLPFMSLQWRHNDHDDVSNHQPHGCLLNRLFGRRSKKTSKLRVTGLCVGNSPGPVNSPHKGPVTRKMFPFDDVIIFLKNKTTKAAVVILHHLFTGISHHQLTRLPGPCAEYTRRSVNCVSIASDNGLSPVRRQAITWIIAHLLSIGPLGGNFSEIRSKIQNFSFKKMHLKMSSAKCRSFCPRGDELMSRG